MPNSKISIFSFVAVLVFLSSSSFAADLQSVAKSDSVTDSQQEDVKVDTSNFYNTAIVQGLNKTTAKTSILEIKIGSKIRFGQISIIAHKCWQSPLDQKPESKILLEIFESHGDESEKRIFYGWMFASSPSISGLENPIYDITALSCKK